VSDATQYYTQRLEALKNERTNFDTQWEEAAERVLPAHSNLFNGGSSTNTQQGEKKTQTQFDGTTAAAAQKFSAVMESLVTPQNHVWHMLRVMDRVLRKKRAVRVFFDELSEILYDYRYRSSANFVPNSQQVFLSLGVYGNGSLYVDQPDNGKGLRYKNIFLGETYFSENHAGVIDTLYRTFLLSPRQVMERFGAASSEGVQSRAEQPTQMDERDIEILHVVMPNPNFAPGTLSQGGMKFISVYMEVTGQHMLRVGGFDTFPYAIGRYTQISGETYGRGPAQYVLPSIKTLNEQKKTMLKQGHRAVDPVLLAFDDGKLGSAQLRAGKLVPGGVSKDGRMLIQPLPAGNVGLGDKMMDMEKAIIHDAFLISLFQILIETPQMTATEVLERAREKGMLLAPTAGRLQAEFLGPLIEREISLLARQGLMPPMPPILQQAAAEYKIEYDNPMSRMARAEKAAGFMRALGSAAEYTKMTGDPSPLDFFNFDVAMPQIMDIHGAPIAWSHDIETVMAKRQQRAQAAQQAQALEALPAMAGMMKNAPTTPSSEQG
jgi:hypothetical protein